MLPNLLRLGLLCALLQQAVCRHQLIVVSCDGFRYDYLDWYKNETQFLRDLIPKGVHMNTMTPAFATKTFATHWTIATGLYQESHGIVSNSMFDPVWNESFNKGTRDEKWWNASLPIWIEAKKQGLKSATFFWPGSEVKFQGLRQDHYFEYNDSYSFEFRVETVLKWITEEKIDFATMYLNEPDFSGHKFGPNSTQVRAAVQKVDNTIRSLFEGLEQRNFSNKVNVLIVADHGMAETSSSRVVNLTDKLDPYVDRYMDSGALFSAYAKPCKKHELVNFLNSEVEKQQLAMRVFTRESLPGRYHYSNNRRIPDVLILPDQGYLVVTSRDKSITAGTHGYDNAYSDMKVPMFAVGPSFKENVVLRNFMQVDIYGIMCHLLEIQPQPNNGSLAQLPLMMKEAPAARNSGPVAWLKQIVILFVYNLVKTVMLM